MKNKISAGTDKISPSIVKDVANIIANPLKYKYCFVQTGKFTNSLRLK